MVSSSILQELKNDYEFYRGTAIKERRTGKWFGFFVVAGIYFLLAKYVRLGKII